jgi:hypothetical protein
VFHSGILTETYGSSWLLPPPSIPSNILFSQLDQTGIAGQAETVLVSWIMPANTLLGVGESIEMHAFGENLADTSVIRFKMGNNTLEYPIQHSG